MFIGVLALSFPAPFLDSARANVEWAMDWQTMHRCSSSTKILECGDHRHRETQATRQMERHEEMDGYKTDTNTKTTSRKPGTKASRQVSGK